MVIGSFHDQGTEDIYDGVDTKAARKTCPPVLWKVARRKLDLINAAPRLEALRVSPSNRLERLRGDREGQRAIRINDQYRICFRWDKQDAYEVEITDYH